MPRPRRPGAPEPKKRSRKGCWPCKARKVKCGEEKPICLNCQRQGELCDYSVRLNWGGRAKRAADSPSSQSSGYGGMIIGFSDISPTGARDSTQIPPVSNAPVDGFVNLRSGEFNGNRAESPNKPVSPSNFNQTTPRAISDMPAPSPIEAQPASTWVDPGPLSKSPFNHAFPGSFSPVADQGVGLRSLSAFSFPSKSVSQPVSFLRNSIDTPGQPHDSSDFRLDEIHSAGSASNDGHRNSGPGASDSNDLIQDLPNTGGISTLMLGSHGAPMARSNAASSPTRDDHQQDTGPVGAKGNDQDAQDSSMAQIKWQAYLTRVTDNYGLDCGHPDRDLALNNDHEAIDINSALEGGHPCGRNDETVSSPESDRQRTDYSGYYASPVPINIPRSLSPLPRTLLENPINLMYFHHFLNHTSRMLVPHDCDNNPFMSVLPSMAIGDPNLLNLLLAYSASHRARYLGHAEPANRIAHLVSDVFPALRVALESPHEDITDGHLATAILLVSLKIVSPGTFEVPITWQSHLKLARDLFLARSERIAYPGNRIGAFFARWLGYIDTMGALSCRQAGPPLILYHSVLATCCGPEDHDEAGVDCFTGFTPRTGLFLIRLAQLVQQCDNQRFDEAGNFRQEWHPSADLVMEAQAVLGDIDDLGGRAHAYPYHHRGIEYQDMMAIEEAFRYAGLLHLHRRVLGSPLHSFPVKDALSKLTGALGRMRLGASTEVCSLFPLFTAGCESDDPTQRTRLLNRFLVLEKSGMKQIQNARRLMQHCWDEKLPWIALARGEFFG